MAEALKTRALNFVDKNERQLEIGFFLGGFLFDVLTLSAVDDPLSIFQQTLYLALIAWLLVWDLKVSSLNLKVEGFKTKIWNYRSLILHFLLGSLLSVYSLFFIKSSSLFSSFLFLLFLLSILVLNEMSLVQKGKLSIKVALFVLCLFSYFSLLVPTALGFVGWIPFLLSLFLTMAVIYGLFQFLRKVILDLKLLKQWLVQPGLAVLAFFTFFYAMGWVPPVPLSIKNIGIYHQVSVENGQYQLKFEREFWKFWQNGAQDFIARPNDKIIIFTSIVAPKRFDDQIIFHWSLYNNKKGWITQDKIPITIKGGREKGFRGYGVKQNFTTGEWRVLVETTNGREIGRIYFVVNKVDEPRDESQMRVDRF